ncbi:MAG: multicopper oxidase domain-containing protein [Candidatus Velthaea sp.]
MTSSFAAPPAPALASPAAAAAPAGAPELPLQPEVRSYRGVAHLQLTAAINPATKLPAFYFAGRPIPPTIRVHPGDTLVVDYINGMSTAAGPPLDMTNLHTHGLLDSPKPPGDDVLMTMVMPGQGWRYVYAIPRDEAPGVYWYHPHPHGASNFQVAAGMSGMIVVEGIETYAPIVRGLAERDIILRDYYFDPSTAPLSRARQRAVMHEVARERALNPTLDVKTAIRTASVNAAALPPAAPDCNPADASKGVTINGLPAATITMRPNSRQFFRILNASANSFFDLKIPGTRFLVVAKDGVPLSFHDRSVQGQWVDHVLMPPAARIEAVVAAPAQTGTAFQSLCIDYGPDGDTDPPRTLGTIALGPEPALPHMNFSAAPPVAEPFGNIHNAPIVARRVVNFSEDNPDSKFYINGKMFDPTVPPMFVVRAGTVEEWTVANYANELHAFHIHQIHFLVEDVNGVRQPDTTWLDTVTVPYATHVGGVTKPGVVHLLMDFRDPVIVGTFVFHCHILEHEDYGMMAEIQVVGPAPAVPNTRGFHQGNLNVK